MPLGKDRGETGLGKLCAEHRDGMTGGPPSIGVGGEEDEATSFVRGRVVEGS